MDIKAIKKELSEIQEKIFAEEDKEKLLFLAGRVLVIEAIITGYEQCLEDEGKEV